MEVMKVETLLFETMNLKNLTKTMNHNENLLYEKGTREPILKLKRSNK